jgi:hypothetical protein
MDFWKTGVVLLTCGFVHSTVFAQLDDSEAGIVSANEYTRYFTMGAGAVRQTVCDESLSTLVYNGYGSAANFGHIKTNGLTWSEFSLQASRGTVYRKGDDFFDRSMRVTRAYVDYRFLFRMKLRNEERYDLRVGGLLAGLFCHKDAPQFLNAGQSYEYAISLGISGMLTRTQEMWGKNCKLTWTLGGPIVGQFARPVFLNQVKRLKPEETNYFNDHFGTTTGAFLGKFWEIKSRVGFIYPLTNGNAINIAYQWDYYQMKDEHNATYFAEHSLSLAYMFNY